MTQARTQGFDTIERNAIGHRNPIGGSHMLGSNVTAHKYD
jgi:hypothetical protein